LSDSHSSDEKRRTLAEKIAQEEQLISEIHAALEHRRALVSSFKEQLAAIEPRADRPTTLDEGATSTTATLSSEEKVRMFRSLFRGREDVFARRWESRSPIVLTERREHLEKLAEELRAYVPDLVVLHGTMKTSTRREALAHFATAPDGKPRPLLATGRYIGEGFDDARLDSLFLALPVSWKGTLIQYSGRLHRLYAGKTEVRIYDYVDRKVPMLLRMFEKRLRGYRAMGYVRVVDNNETREEPEAHTSRVE
jgi:superfamily II DNA or RNA helicase